MKRTIVVTGGTAGIGLQTAIALARSGIRVVITGRDRSRGEAGLRVVRETSCSADVHLALGDLSSLREIRAMAEEIRGRFPRIDALINNAGTLETSRRVTVDGVEVDFAVNVVAPYVLTQSLVGVLSPGARVINVTGGIRSFGLDLTDLEAEKKFLGLATYSRSKRALEAMSLELADELGPRGARVLIVFPGEAVTAMSRGMTVGCVPLWMRPLWPVFRLTHHEDAGRSAALACRSIVWAATSAEIEGVSSHAFNAKCKPMRLHRTVLDGANRRQVVAHVRSIATGGDSGGPASDPVHLPRRASVAERTRGWP